MRRRLTKFWGSIAIALIIVAIFLVVNQVFLLRAFGFLLIEPTYLHLLLGIGLALVFIGWSPTKRASERVAWYDIFLACLSLASCGYFSYHGLDIISGGWMFASPHWGITASCIILCLLVLEALRRVSGLALLLVCTLFLFYPIFAGHMPGFLSGYGLSITDTLTFHALSPQSLIGIPLRVVGTLLMGYIIFGVALMHTGGGKFFLEFATAIFGRFRGGAAKVAIVASSIFGSMSGSSVSNVITTGSVTIPAMKKTGYPAHYAGAVEACASTGGILMPPIMGAAAFLMATILGIPYFNVAIAAAIPSLLYYLGLFIQVDAFAATHGMRGLPPEEIPSLREVLKGGWFYIFALVLLVYFLYLRWTAQAPFYAMLFLLVATMVRKETRLDFKGFYEFFIDTARMVAELTVMLGAVGFIIGALALTGTGATLSGEIVALARENVYLVLLFGATASFILGMGMTTSACYVFLAIVLTPGLVAQGFNVLAVHLFVLYWGILSNITPPVAFATFPAGSIAGERPSKIGFTAMRLGIILYVVPFIFVLSPALILQGSPAEILYSICTALLGLVLVTAGLGRYLVGVGELSLFPAALLIILGLALAFPLGGTTINVFATIGLIMTVGLLVLRRKRSEFKR